MEIVKSAKTEKILTSRHLVKIDSPNHIYYLTAREIHIWLSVENQQFMGNHASRFTIEVFTKMIDWRKQLELVAIQRQV